MAGVVRLHHFGGDAPLRRHLVAVDLGPLTDHLLAGGLRMGGDLTGRLDGLQSVTQAGSAQIDLSGLCGDLPVHRLNSGVGGALVTDDLGDRCHAEMLSGGCGTYTESKRKVVCPLKWALSSLTKQGVETIQSWCDQDFPWWGDRGLNPEPTDYEGCSSRE